MFGGNTILPSMMCAMDKGQGACHGDEGGPLFDANVNILVGIYSGSIGCDDYPGVYSRISNQLTWIKNVICADHSDPKPDFCVTSKDASQSKSKKVKKKSASTQYSTPTIKAAIKPGM